jgi:rhodanese-related sulfurtransferase
MGPLVPDIVTDELNLLVALLVGIAFGFILEQAGFSSSRKLTGLFYGTDFTVLRVFFTAGVTAMTGVLLLGNLGVLDTSIIYINPTFVQSALLGGAIMGVGFVVGGYCPGTSFCGAAVGRIDAMLFVFGGLLGAWGFGEAFPHVQALYTAGSKGDLTLSAALGVAPGVVLLAFTAIALIAFVVTGRIERRVNPASPVVRFPFVTHAAGATALVLVAVAVAVMGTPETRLEAKVAEPGYRISHPLQVITGDEVAYRLLDKDPRLQLVDVRAANAFTAFSLPGAINVPPKDLFGKTGREQLSRPRDVKVFFADEEQEASRVAALAQSLGYENVAVLGGGLQEFRRQVLQVSALDPSTVDQDTLAFRKDAAPKIAALIQARGATKTTEKKVKKVAGGCGV